MKSLRIIKDKVASGVMCSLTITSLLLVVFIGIGLYWKASPILSEHSLGDLLFSSSWRPFKGEFGFFPFLSATIWVTVVAVSWVLPIALLTAIFLTEYAKSFVRRYVFPALDILAALPSVIYGVWGTLVIVPWISHSVAPYFIDFSAGYTVLAASIVGGVMILPLLVSLFVEIFSTVSDDLREASCALGATKWQTTKLVVLKKTIPGILAALVLAISRALGETIAILMVCGNLPQVPHSLLDACYPIPALIANNYGEMLSLPLYESALMFAALILFVVVLLFNLFSRLVLNRMGKQLV